MTLGDFILSILSSLIATLLFESRKSWRRLYDEFPRGVLLLTRIAEQKLTLRRLRLTTSVFMVIITAMVFLSHSPKLATDDIVTQKTPIPKSQGFVTNRVVMRPCVPEKYSACVPLKSKDEVNFALLSDSYRSDVSGLFFPGAR